MKTFSEQQRQRLAEDWSKLAGEPVRIQCTDITSAIYAFGSELACLRLYYRMHAQGRVAYSANMGTWYYANQ